MQFCIAQTQATNIYNCLKPLNPQYSGGLSVFWQFGMDIAYKYIWYKKLNQRINQHHSIMSKKDITTKEVN